MAISKNPGPLLTSLFKGSLDAIPLRWRTRLGITRLQREQPTDVPPSTPSGVLISSEVDQQLTDQRKKVDISIGDPTDVQMVEYTRTKDGQIGTRIVKYVPEGTALPSMTELIVEAGQQADGSGYSEQMVTSVPNLFGGIDYSVERPDVTPQDFDALIDITETSETVVGIATLPVLLTGDLKREEVQVTEQTKRVTARTKDLLSLPISILNFKTNEFKQAVSVLRILELDTATPAVPTATRDVSITMLGDGTALEIREAIFEIFDGTEYAIERTDRVPADFGALLAYEDLEINVEGTVGQPTLAAGELRRSEKQLTDFTKRVTVRGRDLSSLPLTITGKKTNPDKQVVSVTRIWELATVVPANPTALIDVEFTKLGDGTAIEERLGIPNVFGRNDYTRERPDRVPPDFGALLEISETSEDIAGIASDPTLLTGELSRTEKQLTEFTKRITIRGRDTASLPITLTGKKTTPDKQIVSVTRIWELASTVPAVPTALIDVDFTKLGDGTAIEERLGVPNVFGRNDFTREIPDRVPAKFAALLEITETSVDSAGTANDPTLSVGELARTEKQLTEFTKRIIVRARDISALPKTIVDYDTDRDKQVVTVTQVWQLDTVPPDVPTATDDVTYEKLGDGTAIQITRSKAVFPGPVYAKSIENLIPPKFRAFIETTTSEITSTGTANPTPVLGLGEISHEEQQVDAFNIRTKSVNFGAITPPITLTDNETTEEFGGGILDVVYTLDLHAVLTVDTGLLVISSEVTDLGNGYDIKLTKQLQGSNWPVIASRLWDETMWLKYAETKQVVAAGSSEDPDPGGVYGWVSEVKAIDQWRSLKTNTSKNAPDYTNEASALISYAYKPYRFPGLLYYSGTGYYVRSADATLVQHLIKTWWLSSGNPPSAPSIDDIILDDVVINNLSLNGLTYSGPVLHDAVIVGSLSYPATTPSYTAYALGTPTGGTTLHNIASLYSPGGAGGYSIGDVLTISSGGHSMSVTVTFVYDVGGITGLIGATTADDPSGTFPSGTYTAIAASGGGGTGAYFNVWAVDLPNYTPGTGWIGSYRVIGASVTPMREKNLWKVQTESVVMR